MKILPEIPELKNFAKVLLGKGVAVPGRVTVEHVVLGSHFNDWPIVPAATSSQSIVYSFGVGEDISFDLATIHKFGCEVYAFDPTPKSVQWIRDQVLPSSFHFVELGLGGSSGELVFHAPENPSHVSYAVRREGGSGGQVVRSEVCDLRSIMQRMHHEHLNVLKMDVEGCEYAVIESLLSQGDYPDQLMIEFHHGLYGYTCADTKHAIATLRQDGYLPYYVSDTGRDVGFIHKNCLSRLQVH